MCFAFTTQQDLNSELKSLQGTPLLNVGANQKIALVGEMMIWKFFYTAEELLFDINVCILVTVSVSG